MYFEVYNLDGVSTPELEIYITSLTHQLSGDALIALNIQFDGSEKLPEKDVGTYSYSFDGTNLVPESVFPFGYHVIGESRLDEIWRTFLLKKGIASVIEFLLLSKFDKDIIINHQGALLPRRNQLSNMGANDISSVGEYLDKVKRSLTSPHFRIVKFPEWIDPEILKLKKKS